MYIYIYIYICMYTYICAGSGYAHEGGDNVALGLVVLLVSDDVERRGPVLHLRVRICPTNA